MGIFEREELCYRNSPGVFADNSKFPTESRASFRSYRASGVPEPRVPKPSQEVLKSACFGWVLVADSSPPPRKLSFLPV